MAKCPLYDAPGHFLPEAAGPLSSFFHRVHCHKPVLRATNKQLNMMMYCIIGRFRGHGSLLMGCYIFLVVMFSLEVLILLVWNLRLEDDQMRPSSLCPLNLDYSTGKILFKQPDAVEIILFNTKIQRLHSWSGNELIVPNFVHCSFVYVGHITVNSTGELRNSRVCLWLALWGFSRDGALIRGANISLHASSPYYRTTMIRRVTITPSLVLRRKSIQQVCFNKPRSI